jgi:hypothetical protein
LYQGPIGGTGKMYEDTIKMDVRAIGLERKGCECTFWIIGFVDGFEYQSFCLPFSCFNNGDLQQILIPIIIIDFIT